jgi:STE24 endopeptidase
MQLLSRSSIGSCLPPKLRSYVNKEDFEDMQTYSILRLSFSRLESTYGFIAEVGSLLANVFVWTQGVSTGIVRLFFDWTPQEAPITNGVFYLFLISFFSAVMKAPFEIYRITVIDSKFMRAGNTGSAITAWLIDQLKMFVLAVCVGIPLLSLILTLIAVSDTVHWIYMWIGSVACCVFLGELYPLILAPIFNSVHKLEGPMKTRILQLAEKVGVNIQEVEYIDASVRGNNANAVLAGYGKQKRVVLYDGLLEQLDDDEVLAVLAHELGHYKWKHGTKNVLTQAVSMGVFLFALSRAIYNPDFYRSFGFAEINVSECALSSSSAVL